MQFSTTWDQVAAFRLSRHHLADRAPMQSFLTVVQDMAGAQAQIPSAAQISFWSRVRDLQTAHVEKALHDRTLVKAACMRNTLFLVPAELLAVFALGSAERGEKEIRWARGKGVPDKVLDAAIEATLVILDHPLTRPEIAERVSQALGVRPRAIQGGGWGSQRKVASVPVGKLTYPVVDLLHLASARGVICYGHNHGHEPTFVRADAWIPHWQNIPREQAEGILLQRYLKAFGPATAEDFALWSGMTLRKARGIWTREKARVLPVNVEGWAAEVLREDLEALSIARFEPPLIRLLPHFDSYLLAHQDREHLVGPKLQSKVYRAAGWIAPVVLVNGRVGAVWKHAPRGKTLQIQIDPFESFSRSVTHAVRQEAQDLSRFLGSQDVEVQID